MKCIINLTDDTNDALFIEESKQGIRGCASTWILLKMPTLFV